MRRVNPNKANRPLLTNEERRRSEEARDAADHTCPLCGKYAEPGFTRMYCVTTLCANFDYDVFLKHRDIPTDWDEDTIRWKT